MNRLSKEKSPYLKQHAENPVDWYPWGDEAITKARLENKPIFLSVGYSTCHWCHVMEHESFVDLEVARALNQGFVAIKVDREERPDVDALYMEAVQVMTGQGGWPMSVFLTPELKPFYGGTYYPKPHFLHLLEQIESHWKSDPARIREGSEKLTAHLGGAVNQARKAALDTTVFARFFHRALEEFDAQYGGRRGAPKFPAASELRALLRVHRRTGNARALEYVTHTLDMMLGGGIYDHLGGGFHRYSTDERWLVPHFEKMLYDQAMMSSALVEAYQATGKPEYRLALEETLNYVLREMTHKEGGFFSAEDADSEGEEGRFYVWSDAELEKALTSDEMKLLHADFVIERGGNFEHGAHILVPRQGVSRRHRSTDLTGLLAKLKHIRDQRIKPLRDEKIISAWNGLMASAFAKAGRVLQNEKYVEAARRSIDFVITKLSDGSGGLLRRWIDGEAKQPGYLDDFSFVIDACIELHQATLNKEWLEQAVRLQELQDRFFHDPDQHDYFSSRAGDLTLIHRGKEHFDNVQPSGNSVSAWNLYRLSRLVDEVSFKMCFEKLWENWPQAIEHYPWAFPHALLVLDAVTDRAMEVSFQGPWKADQIIECRAEIDKGFAPNLLWKTQPKAANQPMLQLCMDQVCENSSSDLGAIVPRLAEKKSYLLV